ncbi:GxxExxY protein [Rudanella paleaurantiibacter]|uniref:GxxExxY protein n=1 Tax=Rudanella paleaurantiibacter TaxID=2614655 RepID=A0A7J5U4T9_9BACT|nr:GxxExxY protein [Rudanella paleaurantiibacter]KAB7732785.1 GxxExxY protein [Rudanella paleaurantiibacter]
MNIAVQTPTDQLIRCFYKVYNALGYGFLERVYEKALILELQRSGFVCISQAPISVYYEQELVGEYFADILVNDEIILELKAVSTLTNEHEAQLINYLKATPIELGFLFNFGPKPEFKRKVFSNLNKNLF